MRAWTVVDGVEGGAHEGGGGGAEGPAGEVLRHVLGHRRGLLAREDLAPWEGGQGPGVGQEEGGDEDLVPGLYGD